MEFKAVTETAVQVQSMLTVRPPSIDLRQLSYIVAVADAGAISSAASMLGISQPSLSASLTRMEELLGVQLVLRGARGTNLTEAGDALARYGRDVLSGMEVALDEVRMLGGEARGPVAVGFPPSVGLLLGVPLAETAAQTLPQVKLKIAESNSGHVLEWLKTDRIDFGVVYQKQDCSHLDGQPLLVEELYLVVAPDYLPGIEHSNGLAHQAVDFSQLAEFPLVIPSKPHGLRELLEYYAKLQGVDLNVLVEMDALRNIVSMVSRASACTILSHAAVIDEVRRKDLILIPIANPTPRRTAYIVRKRGRPITRASMEVEALIRSMLQELIERSQLRGTLPNLDASPGLPATNEPRVRA